MKDVPLINQGYDFDRLQVTVILASNNNSAKLGCQSLALCSVGQIRISTSLAAAST